jgi:CRP-like cAMP-binding protein
MSDQADIIALLKKTTIFGEVADATLGEIAAIAERRALDEGDAVYQLGDDALDVFVMESGRVRFTLGVGNRAGSSDSIMTEGQVFGWAAMLEDQPRRLATASCLEPSTLLAINGGDLLKIFDRDSAAGFRVMRQLAAMIARNFMEVLSS